MIKLQNIDISSIKRMLGYDDSHKDENIDRLIDKAVNLCIENISPIYKYKVFDIVPYSEFVEVVDTDTLLLGKSISNHLSSCDKAVMLCCSLGLKFDKMQSYLQLKDMNLAYIFDVCGSVVVETLCDKVEQIILKETGLNKATYRYSPGYGDFPLIMQNAFVDNLNMDITCGINVLDDFMLSPFKSITAVMGVSKEKVELIKEYNKCDSCNMRHKCKFKNGECNL